MSNRRGSLHPGSATHRCLQAMRERRRWHSTGIAAATGISPNSTQIALRRLRDYGWIRIIGLALDAHPRGVKPYLYELVNQEN